MDFLHYNVPEGPVFAWQTNHEGHEPRDQAKDHGFQGEPQEEPVQKLAWQI